MPSESLDSMQTLAERYPSAQEVRVAYRSILGRAPTLGEAAMLRRGTIADVVHMLLSSEEFLEQVVLPTARREPLDGRFSGVPGPGAMELVREAAGMGAHVATIASWSEWLTTLLADEGIRQRVPEVCDAHDSAADLCFRTDRAWRRVPKPPYQAMLDPRSRRDQLLGSGLFDPDWYSARYPDIGEADPADHYLRHGASEGRQPSPFFDQARYFAANPDVQHAGANPVLHWIAHGLLEKRRSPIDPVRPSSPVLDLHELCDPTRFEDPRTVIDDGFKISVLTPTYNTPPIYLEELHRTLRNQLYGNWEWVICDDGSSNSDTISTLRAIAAADERVKIRLAPKSRGISAATNDCLEGASGNFIALVDHDDLLSRDVFKSIWQVWTEQPDVDLLYTDECKLSIEGKIFDISLKPAWSPAYLENTMYIGHLTAYRRELVQAIGGFRSAFDGTQDYDLALRASRALRHAAHVDVIGYLWRAIPGSTASSIGEKQWAVRRQFAALREHARTLHPQADVIAGDSVGFWRINYPLPQRPPLMSYVIPTGAGSRMVWGKPVDLITNCIRSLIDGQFYPRCEFVIVHNGDLSQDQLAFLNNVKNVKMVHYADKTLNLARKINMGVEAASGEYVCVLNDDVQAITPHGGDALIGYLLAHRNAGAIAPLCLFEDGRVQHNGVILLEQGPSHSGIFQAPAFAGHSGYLRVRREAFGVTGAMLFVRRDLYLEVGGFDERLPLNYNDVHFCVKIRAKGYSCIVDPAVEVYHFESATKVGTFKCEKEMLHYLTGGLKDPYFNRRFDQRNPYYEVSDGAERNDGITFESWLDARIAYRSGALPKSGPSFTVGVSVYNQPIDQLREMLASLRMQNYENFEILVLDNGSSREETLKWLDGLSWEPRVRLIREKENRGIAGGQRLLLDNAKSKYFIPIDSDDFITIDALTIFASAIDKNDSAKIFYSDEFKSDIFSSKFAPFHKPDFDPIMITNCCFVGHLMCFETEMLRSVGGYSDDRATWCHDWDSTFRALGAGLVPVHVPELLYAWRINPGSTASVETGAKPEAVASQAFVLERTLRSRQLEQKLQLVENRLGANTGMWALSAIDPTLSIKRVDAALWTLPFPVALDRLQRKLIGLDPDGLVSFLLPCDDPAEIEQALAAPALLDGRVDAVGSMLLDSKGLVRFAGGFFGPQGLVVPNRGILPVSGGYHGQLFCQRCVDVVSPVNAMFRVGALRDMFKGFDADGEVDTFIIRLMLRIAESGRLVAVTPHVQTELPEKLAVAVPVDRHGLIAAENRISRWGRTAIELSS